MRSIAKKRFSFCLPLLAFLFLGGFGVETQAKSGGIPTVILIAPEAVREVIKQHFKLPEDLLKSDEERAVFMRRAQREIPELLATEGYFSSRVSLRSVMSSRTLEVLVEPGELTRVSDVEIEFRGDLATSSDDRAARAQQLRNGWQLPGGKAFTAVAWDVAKSDLLAQLVRKDYAAGRLLESSAHVDPHSATAKLKLVLDSGPRFTFGAMHISGLERYSEPMVARYALFKSGEAYDRDQLLKFQRSLQALVQFNSVIVSLDVKAAAEPSPGQVVSAPVKVQVIEAESRKISVGLGYSTNNGERAELNYLSNNFLDRAWSFSNALVLELNRQSITAGVDTLPNPQGFRMLWNAEYEHTQIQGLETHRNKLGVMRSNTVFGNEMDIGLNWQQELRDPEGGIRETNQALVLDWRWIRRTVDDPLMPMSGSLSEVRVGGAGRAFLSDEDFVRSYLRHQSWFPLGDSDVVSLRGEVGNTVTASRINIPQDYLFRVGGTQTVRGFAYQSLGVREGGAVVGGRSMVTASAEYTHWFSSLGVAAFTDAGDAADSLQALRPVVGYGLGARWRSPVGPLALDFARNREVSDVVIHFAIAVAF